MEFSHSYPFVTFVVLTVDQIVGRDDSPLFTGLPYGKPSRKMGRFLRFIIFRVGKSLACHSPAKWCLCA